MSNIRRAKAKKPDAHTLIANAKRAEKTVTLYLRGDIVAEIEHLESQLAEVRPSQRLTGNADAARIKERIEALQAEMQDSAVNFRLRALTRSEWQRHTVEHGPRDGNAEDKAANYNLDTYFPVLVRSCLVEPELTDDEYDRLINEVLTFRQWDQLATASFELNAQDVAVPFSLAASLTRPNSDET